MTQNRLGDNNDIQLRQFGDGKEIWGQIRGRAKSRLLNLD